MTRRFPDGFTWGTATASYQVEGAVAEDGRTPSIWDTFAHTPGKILDRTTGDVACDQYHRYLGDIELMRQLGTNAHRFSVAWPRVVPDADGRVNPAGLDYYSRLVDGLLAAGVAPVLTLYHWDLPQYLQDAGGWPNRDVAGRFADYATAVARALGDRVALWTTLNEPWCSAFLGHADGEHAPGWHDHPAALAAAHHLNLAHGLAAQAVRSVLPDARVSVTLNLHVVRPASDAPADVEAAARIRRVGNDVWLLPMLEGRYDERLFADTAHVTDWAFVRDGDLAQIAQPLAALGVNYYSTSYARHVPAPAGPPWRGPWPGAESVAFDPPKPPLTMMGWNQEPPGLTDLLVEVARRYPGLELIVTENGAAFEDVVGPDGAVHDPQRTDYLRAHVEALGAALDAGAPVTGYFVWSLLDNFEWAWGKSRRFGLLRTDYETQERTWKDSAHWYRRLASTNQLPD